jgi:hypothetical protein
VFAEAALAAGLNALEVPTQCASVRHFRVGQRRDGIMCDVPLDKAELARSALGVVWTEFLSACHDWVRTRGDREDWQRDLSNDDMLSLDVGAYIYSPGDPKLFQTVYEATPANSYTFAWTGVDGEHFSVLLDPAACGVIVATAPMAFDNPNVVVGESTADFLNLVCVGGFAVIPAVAYRGVELGARDIETAGHSKHALLQDVEQHLGLHSWSEVEARLSVLQARFATSVRPQSS